MPRYFFNVRRGHLLIPDNEGLELDGLAAVSEEATAAARDILANDIGTTDRSAFRVEATNERGENVYVVDAAAQINR